MTLIDKRYDKKIVPKPWGYEYVIYRYKNDLSVTCLHIDFKKKTSLHCHPTKKTGFILLDGEANIQLGLYKSGVKRYKAPSKLMIRSGLFHQIQSKSKKGLIALEFETPYKKNDLVRFEDNYGRENTPYEGKNKMIKKQINHLQFKIPKENQKNTYDFKNLKITTEVHVNTKKLINRPKNTIFAILEGGLKDNRGQLVLSPGDIVRTDTIKKLSKIFKIKNKLAILTCKKV